MADPHGANSLSRFDLPDSVRRMLASRDHRLHHLLWHLIRNNWHAVPPAEQRAFAERHPGWAPNHARFVGAGGQRQLNPEAGEAFLYMHRVMIDQVNAALLALGAGPIVPWSSIPAANDVDYPVPGRNAGGDADDPKSDAALAVLQERAAQVLDPNALRQASLARVGTFVETAIHDVLHMRWADPDPGVMAEFPRLTQLDVQPAIDPRFDEPSVDWLGHPYSSHVNPVFWALHGWVDGVITAWQQARGLSSVPWTDRWMGVIPGGHDHHAVAMATEAPLDEVFAAASEVLPGDVGFDAAVRQPVPQLFD